MNEVRIIGLFMFLAIPFMQVMGCEAQRSASYSPRIESTAETVAEVFQYQSSVQTSD